MYIRRQEKNYSHAPICILDLNIEMDAESE